ncbi:reverse transcriptase family protein [Motilimonas cestriensis]|uniref:RNA-directed DNA polymerase n=1 Tax=Motilimonas cestriensis TaxID=2742685 RepID=A0ABS8W797_9GAMM|nr:reverse transcriptase family protein [Motilimonas cestriensis]MCE2594150.1 reverse transcriptase family protein [Motilimonas cestriensis]
MSESSTKLTRQEIYDKIRKSSKEEYILDEMKRLGFWRNDEEQPNLTQEFVEKRAQLMAQLRELSSQDELYSDPEKALAHLHQERKKAALEKREQVRQTRNKTRYENALNWYQKQQKEITYLGEKFSAGLSEKISDKSKLTSQGLPYFADSQALAQGMGISIGELRFLCYQKEVSQTSHYKKFAIEKKTGGKRHISAPMPRLKRAQYWLLENVLAPVKLHSAAHGFVPGRSILSNALPHINKGVVVNFDLKDFFPSISYARVKGLFCKQGYSEELGTLFALLATEPDTEAVAMDGQIWHIDQGPRILPQGAPCSPAITNILCRRLDARLAGMAEKLGFAYTRYADDLSFSSDEPNKVQSLLWRVKQIVTSEGFLLHPDKTKVMRRHQKQEVTGVVVNEKASVDRKTLKRFRAILHQIDLYGPEGKSWGPGALFPSLEGYANFVAMLDAQKGIPLQKQLVHIKRKYGVKTRSSKVTQLNKRLMRVKAGLGEAPRENWWQPAEKPEPILELTPKQQAAQKQARKVTGPVEQEYAESASEQNPQSEAEEDTKLSTKDYIFIGLFMPIALAQMIYKASWKTKIKLMVVGTIIWLLFG